MYSRKSIENEIVFNVYSSAEMHYSIRYPGHWNVFPKGHHQSNTIMIFQPPLKEGGAQELTIVAFTCIIHL